MADLDYAQQNLLPHSEALSDELLDQSSLNTVLDMLAVIDSIEELALLETLTMAQKRQVWDATPEPVKTRLKQIKASALANPSTSSAISSSSAAFQDRPRFSPAVPDRSIDLTPALGAAEATYNSGHTFEESAIDPDSPAHAQSESVESGVLQQSFFKSGSEPGDEFLLAAGDRVVLIAKPKLTATELIAIWDVVEVQGDSALIRASGLGTRNYPVAWMRIYPKETEPSFQTPSSN